MVITRINDWNGLSAYTVEWAFFYTLGKAIAVTVIIGLRPGSMLDRWLGARAR